MASYLERVAKVSDKLGIAEIQLELKSKETKAIKRSVNHVICIDISGSMYNVLGHIRTQLKSRLIDIVGDDDTVTIIWFNDKCGYVCKEIEIKKIKDLRDLNESIDKLLVPSGCTNFFDPIELANNLISKSSSPNGLWDFFFMSDGGHNTGGSWDQVLGQLQILGIKIDNSVICEYGYWADTDRLTQMAEILGGQKIFDKDFESYKVDFEKSIREGVVTEPRIEFHIPKDIKESMRLQLAWTIDGDRITCYSTERLNTIWIPESTAKLYYLKDTRNKDCEYYDNDSSIYSAIYILSEKGKYDLVEQLLYSLQNKDLINFYHNAYGKQRLEEFRSMVKDCISNPPERSEIDRSWKPNSERYCVFDFLNDIMETDALIHLTHPEFKYNFTTAKSVQKIELTEDERFKLSTASSKSKADEILSLAEKRKINMSYLNPTAGYHANQLVWNNERANVSLMVQIPVSLDIPSESNPDNRITVDSYITRNYTIVKDGILNTPELIITVNNKLAGKFKRMKLVSYVYNHRTAKKKGESIIKINLTSLPIVNRKYVNSVSSYGLAKKEAKLLEVRCAAKYLAYLKKSIINQNPTYKSPTKLSEYESYLKSLGITDKGYTPKSELEKSGDFYMATLLETKIEKFSNLPKIEDVLKKRKSGKPFTVSEEYMDKIMTHVDEVISKGKSIDEYLEWIKDEQKDLLQKIAILKFSLIISRRWFFDKDGFSDNKVNIDGLIMSFVFSEKRVDL